MPSSDEIHEAAAHVRKWYWENKIVPEWGEGAAAKEIFQRTLYGEMREVFLKETGTYAGAYSPY